MPKSYAPNTYTLAKETVVFSGNGTLEELPSGAEVQLSGAGFSSRTVAAQVHGSRYFVYLRDLEDNKRVYREARSVA